MGDTAVEQNELFSVLLTNPTNATIADGRGVGTIRDDDFPFLTINDVTVAEDEANGTTNAVFTVTRSGVTTQQVTVDFATANGSATAGSDYAAQNGTLTFAPDQTTQTITVPIIPDTLDEANETFVVNLTNATNARIEDQQGVGTITDNEGTPTVSINDVTLTEGNTGTSEAVFTVTVSNTTSSTVTVDYATADRTATSEADYVSQTGTLTFAPGQPLTQTITVPVNGDTIDEADETFVVTLSNAANATIAAGEGTGTITDNDGQPTISINDVTVSEGDSGTTDAVFAVTLSNPSASTVTVNYTTADGTAMGGSDYTASAATVTFDPGQPARALPSRCWATPLMRQTRHSS